MDENKSDLEKFLSVLSLIISIVAPLVGGSITFFDTKNPLQSLKTMGVIVAIILVFWFVFKVAEKVLQRWIGRTVDSMDIWLQSVFSGFRKKYHQHLIFRHRDFDVKGLSTQGVFTLELERIFVELIVSPQAYHRVSSNITQTAPQELPSGSHVIWDYLEQKNHSGTRLVVLGAPGSGKTTLLKNIALILASGNKQKHRNSHKLPILLFLREHAETIADRPQTMLPEIIQASLEKYQLTAPPKWFEKFLGAGSSIVMLDGLDEVADPEIRRQVVTWVEKQMLAYPGNHFIITSRPFGYRESQLSGVLVLEVMPFNLKQVKRFIDNWYLANELQSSQKDDQGVRMKAQEGADDLFTRLRKSSTLLDLAVNPLLLTMIATVHRYRSSLPGRRVELYKEICEVFLGKRQTARGVDLPMTPAQKQSVLQPLAYHMMRNHLREIDRRSALTVFSERLKLVSPQSSGEEFLQMVENSSGLLLERENGVYGFAHKTFQEYLASVHIIEQGLESELVSHIEDDWWHECIRLYSAQADATAVIEACVSKHPPSAVALTLAIACEDEAREVQPTTRDKLERVLLEGVESKNYETRRIVAEALLSLQVRDMMRIEDNVYIGRRFINHAEYQLFLDEMLAQNKPYLPDHWTEKDFPSSQGLQAAVGIRDSDGLEFCNWLTKRENGEWRFRLPTQNEVTLSKAEIKENLNYWIVSNNNPMSSVHLLQNCPPTINISLFDTILKEDLKIARYIDQMLGLDITRRLIAAKPLVEQISTHISRAAYLDLGIDGINYDRTDWAKATTKVEVFSGLMREANIRAQSFGAKLMSSTSADLGIELVQRIRDSRDYLRKYFLPGSFASDRADKSAKAANGIKQLAQRLHVYSTTLDSDIVVLRQLNQDRYAKIRQTSELNLIEITNFIVTVESEKLASIMALFKQNSGFEMMNLLNMDLSEYPLFDKSLKQILQRDMLNSANALDVKRINACYLRLLLIFAATQIGMEQKVPNFLVDDKQPQKPDLTALMEKIKALYVALAILEARKHKLVSATEGLRIVRERVNTGV
jgi:energy-coupling factor transporter ATP-binding protein EcfA2